MQVYGPTQLHGAQSISAPHATRVSAPAEQSYAAPVQDEVNISDAARLTEQVHNLPEIRQDLVNRIRAQIASGTYETSDKLGMAVEHLLDEIG